MTKKGNHTLYESRIHEAEELHDKGLDLCYSKPKDVDSALGCFEDAIKIRESLLGKFSNDTALSYFRYACVLRDEKKDYFRALVAARRELRMSQYLWAGNRDVPIHASMEDEWLSERIQWFQEVLLESRDGFSELDVVKYSSQLLEVLEYERLGDRYRLVRDWEDAISQYICALNLERSAFARNPLEVADLHVKIGDCYVNINAFESALAEYSQAKTIYQEEFGEQPHGQIGQIMAKFASVHLRKKDFDIALGTFANVYSIYEKVFGTEHKLSIEALQDIRLVIVKEMEYLRNVARQRRKSKSERRDAAIEARSLDLEERSIFD